MNTIETGPSNNARDSEVWSRSWTHFRVDRRSPRYCHVTFDHPPINTITATTVAELSDLARLIEQDSDLNVVVFDSANRDFYLAHYDLENDPGRTEALGVGPTGLSAWIDGPCPSGSCPVVSIASIRGRARGAGSEFVLACDLRFASRENTLLGQFEVGMGLVPGGGPMARLSRLAGRGRALEVVLSANDIPADLAERYGYVNRSLPDAALEGFVDALATRIASFDKQTIADTKRLVNVASLPPDIEIESGWDACVASMGRPVTQQRIKTLLERGFCKPGDAENRLGDFVGR